MVTVAEPRTPLRRAEEGDRHHGEESEEEVESDDYGSEVASLADLCESDASSDDDPTFDPAADGGPDGEAALWSRMARLSISGRKGRKGSAAPKLGKEDTDLLAKVDRLIQDGQLEKLKVYECQAYLRMHKLRLKGKKQELLDRIKEYIEVKNFGDVKYPVSSFVLDCKGDSCKGDVVMFEQNIYRRKKGAPRGVQGRLCDQRINAGRIVHESYGTAKQQHTFTIEILWSKGYKPWPPLHPLLIKGRHLYKLTMRQPWPDEQERNKALQEKHERGLLARKSKWARMREEEKIEKMRRNRIKENKGKEQQKMDQKSSHEVLPQQKVEPMNTVHQRKAPAPEYGELGNTRQQQISLNHIPTKQMLKYPQQPNNHHGTQGILGPAPYLPRSVSGNATQQQISSEPTPTQQIKNTEQTSKHQPRSEVLSQEGAKRTSGPEIVDHQVPFVQHVEPEKTRQHQIHSWPTSAPQMLKHPQQHNNEVLLQEGTARTSSVHGQAPSLQHGGSATTRPQQKYSNSAYTQHIKSTQQPSKYHDHNEVLQQEGAKRTYRADCIDHRNGTYHTTGYDDSAFQPLGKFNQHSERPQYGSNGHQHARADHQRHQPLRPRNQDFHSRNQSEYYYEQRHHLNQYGRTQEHQQIRHQNYQESRRMNGYQNHPQMDHRGNSQRQSYPDYQYSQRHGRLKPCFYYQEGRRCPYGENCKYSHGN